MAAVFGGLQSDKYDRQYSDFHLLKRIAAYVMQYKLPVILTLAGFLTSWRGAGAATGPNQRRC